VAIRRLKWLNDSVFADDHMTISRPSLDYFLTIAGGAGDSPGTYFAKEPRLPFSVVSAAGLDGHYMGYESDKSPQKSQNLVVVNSRLGVLACDR
jgi:hypothetical protein